MKDSAAPADEDDSPGGGVVGLQGLPLGGQQDQHQPRRRHRHPGGVHRPRLPGEEFGSGPGVVAEESGQRRQQTAEVGAANLTGDPQRLAHPVADRVGERVLEPVETIVEPAGGAVVGAELRNGSRSCSGPRTPIADSASGNDSPARTPEVRLSTTSGQSSRRSA